MTKDEALDLALEALEELNNTNSHWWQEVDATTIAKIDPAITAIKQALANEALDKMAENARELGLDYEPANGTQVSKVWWDGEKLMAKPIPLEDIYQPAPVLYQLPDDLYDSKDWKVGSYAERVEWLHTMYEAKKRELEYCLDAAQDLQTELEATNRQVEILSDALAESRREVAALKDVQEQPVLIPASLADKQFERYYRQGYDAGFAAQRPVPEERKSVRSTWVGLSHDEFRDFASTFEYGTGGLIRAIEAKLKAKNSP